MGAFTGGLTFRQYFVREPLPAGFRDAFQEKIALFAFKEIDPASEEERALGWCSARFVLDVDLHPDLYLFNDYLVLGLRVDTLAVPGPLLKLHTEKEVRRVMEEQGVESLSRYQKAEIKEMVKLQLRKRILPSVKAFDMVWNIQTGHLRFWSGNEKLNQEFLELFEDTFERVPVLDSAYTAALHGDLGFEEGIGDRLAALEPSVLVTLDDARGA